MKIDKHLNLVLPIDDGEGKTIYVHSTPISRQVFERYFNIIAKTFAMIYTGLGSVAGPRVAAMMLKKIATDHGEWEGEEGVERGLVKEMHRLTNIIVLTDKGWATVPYDQAAKQYLSDDTMSEVENAIVFFTVASLMHWKGHLLEVLNLMSSLWPSQIESSNCTEFANSLPILTGTGSSGETATPSSIPS